MNVNQLWRAVLHPIEAYRRFREWRAKEKFKCVVRINQPRMRIKGRSRRNMMDDPNFPTYYAFFGIPYAEPPVGKLRFQPPQPLTSKFNVAQLRRAYEPGQMCLQAGEFEDPFQGSEDCLYLNIYVPDKPKNMMVKRPVIVHIHGGGFERGSGDITELMPDAIIRENLVVVTVNYRLHVFGFLNTGTEECRGNAGLKDQTAALRWIKANIEKFGGDPNNVTITGHSAGATCVNLHMISPLSKGLFHKAIVMGGGLHCPWGYQGDAQRPKILFSRAIGHKNELRYTLAECLMSESPLKLLAITYHIILNVIQLEPKKFQVFCGPTRERNVEGAFIPQDIDELMRCADPVPVIAGITAGEGNMFILGRGYEYQAERVRKGYSEIVKNDEEFLGFLKQNLRWSDASARKHMNTIREWYFPKLTRMSREEIQDGLAKLNTDIWFRRFYDNFKIGPSGKTPTLFYVYKFSFLARAHAWRFTDCGRAKIRILSPTHGDDESYVFCPQILRAMFARGEFSPEAKEVIDHMCSMWANFCRTEVPESEHEDVEWTPHTDERPCYLNINQRSRLVPSRLNQIEWQRLSEILDSEPVVATPLPSPVHCILNFLPPRPKYELDIEQ